MTEADLFKLCTKRWLDLVTFAFYLMYRTFTMSFAPCNFCADDQTINGYYSADHDQQPATSRQQKTRSGAGCVCVRLVVVLCSAHSLSVKALSLSAVNH